MTAPLRGPGVAAWEEGREGCMALAFGVDWKPLGGGECADQTKPCVGSLVGCLGTTR